MNREIKFRMWRDGRMQGVHTMYSEKSGSDTPTEPADFTFHQDEILMQYTGLKDKNGKEIYEGDIMKRVTGYTFTMEVTNYQMGDKNCASCYGWQHHPDDEIIGNIYEHKHLIENGKQ